MLRTLLLVLALGIGSSCTGVVRDTERPVPPPGETGGTFYVLELWNDFFDDGGKLFDPTEGFPTLFGEQAMAIILRAARWTEEVRVLGVVKGPLRKRDLNVFAVPEPLHYFERRADGKYALRDSPHQGAFRLVVTPVPSEKPDHVTLRFALVRGIPRRSPIHGTELQAGAPYSVYDKVVKEGIREIPLRASLFWVFPREDGRMHALFFHAAGLSDPPQGDAPPPMVTWVKVGSCYLPWFRKFLEPLLKERGIPSVFPDGTSWGWGPLYVPRSQALEVRRLSVEGDDKEKLTLWSKAFEPLGDSWVYVGSPYSRDFKEIIIPLLRSKGIAFEAGEPFGDGVPLQVRASRFLEATRLIVEEMKTKNRPFTPAALEKPGDLVDIDRY